MRTNLCGLRHSVSDIYESLYSTYVFIISIVDDILFTLMQR